MGLSLAAAERWVERWERQQQRYAVDRDERFTVIADVVEHSTAGRPDRPLVADLGCGPGSVRRAGPRLCASTAPWTRPCRRRHCTT